MVWPRGEAAACKAVYTGSNPVATSVEVHRFLTTQYWAIGAAVARFPDTEEVTGSIPVSPTRKWLISEARYLLFVPPFVSVVVTMPGVPQ